MQANAQAQPNIALIKYWGKRNIAKNLPAVDSLSITLDSLWTRMSVEFLPSLQHDELFVNGRQSDSMQARVSYCLDQVAGSGRAHAKVQSEGNFPIAAGLASSASAFAALVVAASNAADQNLDTLSLARLAGESSGSAARSLYAGFVELTAGESDIEVATIVDNMAWPLKVIVAVTEEGAKPLSSGAAMIRSAETSPFYSSWLERQANDVALARKAVLQKDFAQLGALAEHNCLKMHSVMWSSRPPIVYWNSATLACMQAVRRLQAAGCPVFFTIDAGPQLKAVCLPEAEGTVEETLAACPGVVRTLVSGLGVGATLLANT